MCSDTSRFETGIRKRLRSTVWLTQEVAAGKGGNGIPFSFVLLLKLLHCSFSATKWSLRKTPESSPASVDVTDRKLQDGWPQDGLLSAHLTLSHTAPFTTLCDNLIKTQPLGFGCSECKCRDQSNLLPVPFLWSNSKLVVSIQFVIMTVFNHGVYSAARCRIEVTHATIQA